MTHIRDIRRSAGWSLCLLLALAASAFAQATAAAGQTLRVNGFEMYYETSGQGQPLVLLHGFNSSGASWAKLIPEFASGYRVIVPDLRGHGRSTNPSRSSLIDKRRSTYSAFWMPWVSNNSRPWESALAA